MHRTCHRLALMRLLPPGRFLSACSMLVRIIFLESSHSAFSRYLCLDRAKPSLFGSRKQIQDMHSRYKICGVRRHVSCSTNPVSHHQCVWVTSQDILLSATASCANTCWVAGNLV